MNVYQFLALLYVSETSVSKSAQCQQELKNHYESSDLLTIYGKGSRNEQLESEYQLAVRQLAKFNEEVYSIASYKCFYAHPLCLVQPHWEQKFRAKKLEELILFVQQPRINEGMSKFTKFTYKLTYTGNVRARFPKTVTYAFVQLRLCRNTHQKSRNVLQFFFLLVRLSFFLFTNYARFINDFLIFFSNGGQGGPGWRVITVQMLETCPNKSILRFFRNIHMLIFYEL